METLGNNFVDKSTKKYSCDVCNYITSHKGHYEEHLNSLKHCKNVKKETGGNKIDDKPINQGNCCEICSKEFTSRSGLWKHKAKGTCSKNIDAKEEVIALKEIMKYLMKENSEMKNMMMEQQSMMMNNKQRQ